LNVIPLSLPPLRERVEDIPLLVQYFVRKFSARFQKSIDVIPPEVVDALKAHDWPGNIRELQNHIERAVVLSSGPVLRPTLTELRQLTQSASTMSAQTLADATREHILEVLDQCGGIIGGKGGAADRLGLPRTTLIYKMHKLGIEARRSRRAGRKQRPATPDG